MATHYGNRPPQQGGYGYRNDRAAPQAPTIQVDDIRFSPIPKELFGDIAKEKAKKIWEAGLKRDREGKLLVDRSGNPQLEKNKLTQLRKFYDELVLWHDKVHLERSPQDKQDKYDEVAPFIKMMKAKVAYAKGRDHVDSNFEKLIKHLVDEIKDVASLKHAKLFMEAFMGFYKAQEK